ARFCRIPLKIAVQCALLLRNCQLIFRLREVIHTDIQISGFEKLEQTGAKNLKLLHAFRQMPRKRALLFFEPRHVRIAEQGHAVRGQLQNLVNRMRESLRALIGQSVNQIHVDALEAQLTSGKEQIAGQFERLNAVNGLLHFAMEILDSHAQAIESQAAQSFEVLAGRDARVDLNADLRVGCKRKASAHSSKQVFDLFGGQIGRSSATPMKLHDLTVFRNASADPLHFLFQDAEVRLGDALVLLNDYAAGAEQAQTLAKWDVHV